MITVGLALLNLIVRLTGGCMKEIEFQKEIISWCSDILILRKDPRLIVKTANLITALQPWSDECSSTDWYLSKFNRQIDVVIGLQVNTEEHEISLIPLIAIELKSTNVLNTDELDKKSAIYGSLREVYPWIHTIILNRDNQVRKLGEKFWVRNARQFDTVITDWNDESKIILREIIYTKLKYLLDYWKF
jgi:hypothetical protein